MANAIVISTYGASDAMRLQTVEIRAPKSGELRICQTAIGVNFHDVYVRSGLYKTLTPPGILGCEAAGVIEEVGPDVDEFNVGDRVVYVIGPPYGAYASHRILPAAAAIALPDSVDDKLAAAILLRAMTVDMLTRRVLKVEAGMTVLIHAAAGGVGRLLCQMAAHSGATVIGTVGSAEKAEIAQQSGCAHPILYRDVDFSTEVRVLTNGNGVDAVFDSIGADTFAGSLASLSKRGHLINFGQSSGPVDPIAMSVLAEKSLTISRPILFHYLEDRQHYQKMAAAVFDAFAAGIFRAETPHALPLAQAASAHDLIESRSLNSSLILIP